MFVVLSGRNHFLAHLRLQLVVMIIVILAAAAAWGTPAPLSVAFYYADNPPVNELKAFDIVVVDPDHSLNPASYGDGPSRLFAYVSVGEADPQRISTNKMDPAWLIGDNKAWKSRVVDVSNPEWRQFFLDKVVEPLWQAGYRGFFLDTLDSYHLAASKEALPAMQAGLVETIRAIRKRHPEARLILNRGFEIFERIKGDVFAVAAESLFHNFNPATGQYGSVTEEDRQWLLSRLSEVQKSGVPVIAIDYVPPGNRSLTRQTAAKIKALGITPWVSDKALSGLGVGRLEVMPRVILGLYDGAEGDGDAFFTNLQRYAVMPLNYLGYSVKLHDLSTPLPAEILAGRYAGVVVWANSGQSGEKQDLKKWTLRCITEEVPIVFLERFGFPLDSEFAAGLGLELTPFNRLAPPARVVSKDAIFGFEQQPLPNIETFLPMKLKSGTPLLQLASANGITSDAAAITPWGGYVYGKYVLTQLLESQAAWVVDPFRFFKQALRLPDMPIPDTTTENGLRLLLSHVDGDGFESRAEWRGGRLAAEELKNSILDRYKIPVTISLITSSLAPDGLYPKKSAQLEGIARGILALPWVEGASHSFSHPFRWKPDQSDTGIEAESWHTVKVPNYTFNLDAEISGSLNYINERLMPPGKRTRIFQWTGNCLPGEDALRLAYQADALNINGGSTLISTSNLTVTEVAPLGISRGPWFQVFAPNQNENVYTNLWSGNFYGYSRIIETFQLTDSPRRLKPVNIYYHFYSATKEASLNALRRAYDWAMAQPLFSIYTSEYIEKVLDFNRTVIARDDDSWLVRNNGKLRELRIPRESGYPDLTAGSNIAGFTDNNDNRYLHLGPGGEARVRLTSSVPAAPYIETSGAYLDAFERTPAGLQMITRGYVPFEVKIGNGQGCRLITPSAPVLPGASDTTSIKLPEGSHALAVSCQ
ncbi:bifunctional glycoside hydrolase 114/ polysaccharide deacetylase family protein [Geobacter chapellei]|uniref:Bifunctional glycoside hydrolase 114/ polysaccharide deacetylase family protein n=1 Tax=Pelotalea chapellei TaxID=44671 RepID=A0ABS5U853_9BACT|nr:bifunctional glycoside hydrolase 114/ polysaccharide deacetylase family protein [Pelotalea chapellei]